MSIREEKKKFRQLHGKQKLQYIWDYYKFPIAVACIFFYIAAYILYGQLTEKNTVLHTALINVSAGEDTKKMLSEDFLHSENLDTKKNGFLLTDGLHLTSDEHDPYYEYTHASRVKILANINNKELDIVLMDEEVFHAFAENEYLYNLQELLSDSKNSPAYDAITEEYPVGIDLSDSPLIKEAGFEDKIYLGVIKNSTRMDMAEKYIRYFFS